MVKQVFIEYYDIVVYDIVNIEIVSENFIKMSEQATDRTRDRNSSGNRKLLHLLEKVLRWRPVYGRG